ncbi:hypothetical protein AMTR_s00007p00047490, partial [Amborella trichopoda]
FGGFWERVLDGDFWLDFGGGGGWSLVVVKGMVDLWVKAEQGEGGCSWLSSAPFILSLSLFSLHSMGKVEFHVADMVTIYTDVTILFIRILTRCGRRQPTGCVLDTNGNLPITKSQKI